MPKIINKEQKRKEIALKAYEFIRKYGIKEFSTSALIKYMNIGKSSLYNYYKSKDEILYEVQVISTDQYIKGIKENLKSANNLKEKLNIFFSFYLIELESNDHIKELVKECIITTLENKTPCMIKTTENFLKETNIILFEIFDEEIKKGNIKKEVLELVEFLQMSIDGIFIYSYGLKDFDLSKKVQKFIDGFIKLIEIKE